MVSHNLQDHKYFCIRELGKPFTEVHKWMDAPSWGLRRKHRRYRHNILATPKQVREMFGPDSDKACVLHILLDFVDDPKLLENDWLRKASYNYLVKHTTLRMNNHHETAEFLREFYNKREVITRNIETTK